MKTTHTTGTDMLKAQTTVHMDPVLFNRTTGVKKPYRSITIEDGYLFKGSTNYQFHISADSDGLIIITSAYNEEMAKCYSLKSLAEFLMKLSNDELA